MPIGPQGQKRPADSVACAVAVARIATGEADEVSDVGPVNRKGSAGGLARSAATSPARRKEIAENASAARWKKEGTGHERAEPLKGRAVR